MSHHFEDPISPDMKAGKCQSCIINSLEECDLGHYDGTYSLDIDNPVHQKVISDFLERTRYPNYREAHYERVNIKKQFVKRMRQQSRDESSSGDGLMWPSELGVSQEQSRLNGINHTQIRVSGVEAGPPRDGLAHVRGDQITPTIGPPIQSLPGTSLIRKPLGITMRIGSPGMLTACLNYTAAGHCDYTSVYVGRPAGSNVSGVVANTSISAQNCDGSVRKSATCGSQVWPTIALPSQVSSGSDSIPTRTAPPTTVALTSSSPMYTSSAMPNGTLKLSVSLSAHPRTTPPQPLALTPHRTTLPQRLAPSVPCPAHITNAIQLSPLVDQLPPPPKLAKFVSGSVQPRTALPQPLAPSVPSPTHTRTSILISPLPDPLPPRARSVTGLRLTRTKLPRHIPSGQGSLQVRAGSLPLKLASSVPCPSTSSSEPCPMYTRTVPPRERASSAVPIPTATRNPPTQSLAPPLPGLANIRTPLLLGAFPVSRSTYTRTVPPLLVPSVSGSTVTSDLPPVAASVLASARLTGSGQIMRTRSVDVGRVGIRYSKTLYETLKYHFEYVSPPVLQESPGDGAQLLSQLDTSCTLPQLPQFPVNFQISQAFSSNIYMDTRMPSQMNAVGEVQHSYSGQLSHQAEQPVAGPSTEGVLLRAQSPKLAGSGPNRNWTGVAELSLPKLFADASLSSQQQAVGTSSFSTKPTSKIHATDKTHGTERVNIGTNNSQVISCMDVAVSSVSTHLSSIPANSDVLPPDLLPLFESIRIKSAEFNNYLAVITRIFRNDPQKVVMYIRRWLESDAVPQLPMLPAPGQNPTDHMSTDTEDQENTEIIPVNPAMIINSRQSLPLRKNPPAQRQKNRAIQGRVRKPFRRHNEFVIVCEGQAFIVSTSIIETSPVFQEFANKCCKWTNVNGHEYRFFEIVGVNSIDMYELLKFICSSSYNHTYMRTSRMKVLLNKLKIKFRQKATFVFPELKNRALRPDKGELQHFAQLY